MNFKKIKFCGLFTLAILLSGCMSLLTGNSQTWVIRLKYAGGDVRTSIAARNFERYASVVDIVAKLHGFVRFNRNTVGNRTPDANSRFNILTSYRGNNGVNIHVGADKVGLLPAVILMGSDSSFALMAATTRDLSNNLWRQFPQFEVNVEKTATPGEF